MQQWIAALAAPTATTGAASSVGESSAVLNGSATAVGAAASVYYQWGTTTAYGNTTAAVAASSSTAVDPQAALTGIAPSTTYHLRLVAASADGTAYGADQSLTTSAAPPPPSTPTTTARPRVQTMTLADARYDTHETLHGALRRAWAVRHVQQLRCQRRSRVRFLCAVAWWQGTNDYYGQVSVWNVLVSGATEWTDHYAIRWVNNRCYFDSGHRARCRVRRRAGNF
ncbi:MAG: hypothetical protein M0T77_07180 [Actinomycetota bacterium]|nr:hypothetical protein [Actinomycetota bacterium]